MTSYIIWAQLDFMSKKRTEDKPEEHWYCHYSDRADGLSREELVYKESQDKHTHTRTHLNDITVKQFKQEK